MDIRDLYRRVGSMEQIRGIKDYRLIGGKADGMRAVDLYNTTGISLTVLFNDRRTYLYGSCLPG